ncbi:MAG: TetR/AcrR family transcriptional regulator C-terminal domain-containing protein [Propionicimonas sp.]|uniref:TetR/AcrR family transcriptional regulator C-terminal domain-containing protein n=1 Tax=Propionicimonas sp. TaxID=1955623 RepID=UPI003D0FC896
MAKGISRELIVQTALDLLDEQGIDGVTARALAHRLGVKAPALYWHMSSKQEILDEMGTEISRRVARALADESLGASWSEGLAAYARVLRREYLAHRDGARTFSGTKLTDPDVLRAQEPWLEHLVASGISLEHGIAAAQLVTAFVVGFVIEEQERTSGRYPLAERDAALGDDAPLVRESGRHLVKDPTERFEAYLDVVLAGVAARYGTKEDG